MDKTKTKTEIGILTSLRLPKTISRSLSILKLIAPIEIMRNYEKVFVAHYNNYVEHTDYYFLCLNVNELELRISIDLKLLKEIWRLNKK